MGKISRNTPSIPWSCRFCEGDFVLQERVVAAGLDLRQIGNRLRRRWLTETADFLGRIDAVGRWWP